jgi:hypothetical protein
LHRCLWRNGLSRLPKEEEQTGEKKKFKDYPIGYMHVDITEFYFGKKNYTCLWEFVEFQNMHILKFLNVKLLKMLVRLKYTRF